MKMNIPDYSKAKVLVIGDLMLDSYFSGPASRISPEAPVPIVRVQKKESRPGGAANVALNIASLGGECTLVGYVGIDREGSELTSMLVEKGVFCRFIQIQDYPTITKTRVLSRHQQLIRLDFEQNFTDVEPSNLMAVVRDCINEYQVIVLSDYGKGVLKHAQDILKIAKSLGKIVLIDPKGTDFERYDGATVITPNMSEFEAVAGTVSDEADLASRARDMMSRYHLSNLLVTRSEKGMSLFSSGEEDFHLPTNAREVYDVTGAGDTVIAVLAASLATGRSFKESCALSNVAAGIVVGKLGTSTVSVPELVAELGDEQDKDLGVVSEAELKAIVAKAKSRGEVIVMTNGCFDILHSGHCQYLRQARALGDRLIVAVNTDESVRGLKGDERPVNSLKERMEVLASLGCVDWVVSFEENTPRRLISEILPDILVKGGDYKVEEIAGSKEVIANGGRVEILPFKEGCSTTGIIKKIRNL
jgi:D-beta-D-heptose 7-phosphate kinase/D-beta-D-heptose 1-phosphate adenosyltransferase